MSVPSHAGLRVVGYAIVSADSMIADAAGRMPASIIHAADQRFFASGLDAADIIVHGRNSHEQQPQSAERKRLVVTRTVADLAADPANSNARRWNPAGATLEAACAMLGVRTGVVAIIGGTDVFGYFLPRYDAFHLTRAAGALLPGGRPVFPGIPPHTPEELLQAAGLHRSAVRVLDAEADVTVSDWLR